MMTPLDPIKSSDANSLAMENELLRYEVAHVRARMSEMHDRMKELQDAPPAPSGVAPHQQAYDDLVWLLRRLDTSPAGVALRRVRGFRTLRERYLSGPST